VRIVVWNCRMAFAQKRSLLYHLLPDVAVIPECSRSSMQLCKPDGFESCWWGENQNKGLGVVVAKPWSLEVCRPPRQKWIAPVRVHGPDPFLLIAVWATQVGTVREANYVGQIYEAILRHPRWFQGDVPTVIGGDFNSNAIFDARRRKRNHSAVVRMLADRDLVSAYHAVFSEEHGAESRPTYYFWHRQDRPFHLDYIFLPRAWANRIQSFEVGSHDRWSAASDHMPLVVEISRACPAELPGQLLEEVTNSRTLRTTDSGASASSSTAPS
jgi:exonuclease III